MRQEINETNNRRIQGMRIHQAHPSRNSTPLLHLTLLTICVDLILISFIKFSHQLVVMDLQISFNLSPFSTSFGNG